MSGEISFFDESVGAEAAMALEALSLDGDGGEAGEAQVYEQSTSPSGRLGRSSVFSLKCTPAFRTRLVAAASAANQPLASFTRPLGDCNGAYLILPGRPLQLRPVADTSRILQPTVQVARREYGVAGDWMASLVLPSPDAAVRLKESSALACSFFPSPYHQATCVIYTTDARLYICRLRYAAPPSLEVLSEHQFESGTQLNQIVFFEQAGSRAGEQASSLGLCLFLVTSHDALGKTITRLEHMERYVPREPQNDSSGSTGRDETSREQLGIQLRQAVHETIAGSLGPKKKPATTTGPDDDGVMILDDELQPQDTAEAARDTQDTQDAATSVKLTSTAKDEAIPVSIPTHEPSNAVPSREGANSPTTKPPGDSGPPASSEPQGPTAEDIERDKQVQESLRLQRLEERLVGRLEGTLERVLNSVPSFRQASTAPGGQTRQPAPPCLLLPGFHAVFENETYTPASILGFTLEARRDLLLSAERVNLRWNSHGRVDGAQYITVTPADSSKHVVKTSLMAPAMHADIKEDGYCLLRAGVLTVHPYSRPEWRATFSPSKVGVLCAMGSQNMAAVGFADGTVIVYRQGLALQAFTVAGLRQRGVDEKRRDRDPRSWVGPDLEDERLYSLLADGDLLAVFTASSVYVLDTFSEKLVFFARLPFLPTFIDFLGSTLFIGSRDGELSALNFLSTFEAAQCAWVPVFSCREYEQLRVRKLHAAIEAATTRRDSAPPRRAEISRLSPVFYHPLYINLEPLSASTMASGMEVLEEFVPRDLLEGTASPSAAGQSSRGTTPLASSPAFSLSAPFTLSCLEVPNADPRFTLTMDTLMSHIYGSSSNLDLSSLKRCFSQDLEAIAQDFPITTIPHLRASALDSSSGVRVLALTPPINALQDTLDFYERSIHLYGLLLNNSLASYTISEDVLVLLEKNFDLIVMSYAREALLHGFAERARVAGRLLRTRKALSRYPSILASSGYNEMADEFSNLYSQLFGASDESEVYSVRQTETIPGSVSLLGGVSVWAVRSEGVGYGVNAMKRGMVGLVQRLRNEVLEMRQYRSSLSREAEEARAGAPGRAGQGLQGTVVIDDAEGERTSRQNPFSMSQAKGDAPGDKQTPKLLSGQELPVAQSTPARSPFSGGGAPQKEAPPKKSGLDILRRSKR